MAAARTTVQVAFRHFRARVNGDAMAAALAAEAADAQGRFWEMHDLLFANTQGLDETGLTHLALRAGVEIYRFAADFATERYAPKIRRDLDGGVRSGVVRTPAFFLDGIIIPDGVLPEALAALAAGSRPPAARYAPCNDMPHRLDLWCTSPHRGITINERSDQ
jgi:protein-disulfide isomerase